MLHFWIRFFFMFVWHTVLSLSCSLSYFVVTCWYRAHLLALWYLVFSCVFVTFLCGFLCQVWYLFVSNPHLCLLPYFVILLMCVFVILSSLFLAALLPPAGRGLTSWLSCVLLCFCYFPIWCPGSGVVLYCIDS